MSEQATTWPAARQAYHDHHAACPQCRAAGAAPATQQRCPEGLALWGQYNQAGDPPHFQWPARAQRLSNHVRKTT